MRFILSILLMMAVVSCSRDLVTLPDRGEDIDANTARIALLELNDVLQDTRLSVLEAQVADLEKRMAAAEVEIDSNNDDILTLFGSVADLDDALLALRAEMEAEIRALKKADKNLRRELRKRIAQLRAKLYREIRARKLADADLQGQIDAVALNLAKFEAKQKMFNKFVMFSLMMVNGRISRLERDIDREIDRLNRKIRVQGDRIDDLQRQVRGIKGQLAELEDYIEAMESKLVSVVYPCGDEEGEVLLQTQGGLVRYMQFGYNEEIDFEIDEYVPEHYTCTKWKTYKQYGYHYRTYCDDWNRVPGTRISESMSFEFFVLEEAYLGVLEDGEYETDSCEFTVEDGELVDNEEDDDGGFCDGPLGWLCGGWV